MRQVWRSVCVVAVLSLLGSGAAFGADYSVAGIDNPALVTHCLTTLRQAVSGDDREGVAALVRFPIKATVDGRLRSVKNKAAFLVQYDAIMTEAVRAAILKPEHGQLFVNSQGVMLGDGQIWLGLVGRSVRVIAINN